MIRGEIWTAASSGPHVGRARPVVIVQRNSLRSIDTIVVCPFTRTVDKAPLFRIVVIPTEHSGLREPSRLMADKIFAIPKSKLGVRIGDLDALDMARLEQAITFVLDLPGLAPGLEGTP
jgi:mRNA interferase MazF